MIFDGKAFAAKLEEKVRAEVVKSVKVPKVISILAGNDPASVLYSNLKKKAAERVGVNFEIKTLKPGTFEEIAQEVKETGAREDVNGLMIQLPVMGLDRKQQKDLLSYIPLHKDIDGLRWEESGVVPATVRAVLEIMQEISVAKNRQILVVGSEGSVGKPLVHFLQQAEYVLVEGIDIGTQDSESKLEKAEVVISCVGKPGLITAEKVKDKIIAIDVGISQVDGKIAGDMTREVYENALVAVPVPGGVGPVTIACLLMKAVELSISQI